MIHKHYVPVPYQKPFVGRKALASRRKPRHQSGFGRQTLSTNSTSRCRARNCLSGTNRSGIVMVWPSRDGFNSITTQPFRILECGMPSISTGKNI